jgi:ABC-type Fe3+/spermidine/putrescine transport system ATPase subunit
MRLEISDVHRSFPAVEALRGVDLTVESGEFFAVLGPSGAGKTTLLRVIAGIDRPTRGTIRLDGRDLADVPVRARDTAMVFQTFALYPHLSTFENLAYPLRQRPRFRDASAKSPKCCGSATRWRANPRR